ncbi:MAG: PQQ-binding-like beta-propeller repeat protein [Deltaproteobacteria bacterium]|nr:PQQ-binding-like beta-propeller repeat protein [Deltaproteobacteria bacterium]
MRRNSVFLAALIALIAGCTSSGSPPRPRTREAAQAAAPIVPAPPAREVAAAAERFVSRERVTGPDEELGTRVEVRELPVPEIRRGTAAPFAFEDGRRGWVAELPSPNLLVTPAYADGKVFVGGGFSSTEMYALDAATGALRWRAAASDGGPSAAIIDEDRVIFNTESCTVFAIDARTGRELWKNTLGDPMMAQPAAADGRVFAAHAADGGHRLTALAAKSGRILWSVPLGADVISAPTVANGSLYFTTMDGVVERRDPATGRSIWKRRLRGVTAPWVDGVSKRVLLSRRVSPPAGARGPHEEQVVLSAATGRIESHGVVVPAPHLRGSGRARRILQRQPGAWGNPGEAAMSHLGVRNVADGWAYQGARPTVIDGRSYAAVGDSIECREVETGRLLWKRRYAQDHGAQAMSPPAVIGAQMVVATIDGHVYAIDIDTGSTTWAYDVGEPIAYQPSVARGWVYVGTASGKVIAFEAADRSLDGWHMWGGNAAHDGLTATPRSPRRGTSQDAAPGAEDRDDAPREGTLRVVPPGSDEPVGLPLDRTDVQMSVTGFAASVSVKQRFSNPFEEPLEAMYHFPLPTNAAVDAMILQLGDRTIIGRIERKARARVLYHAAKEAGAIAALLEEQRPDLFSQRVANVPPGGHVTVELHYVQVLPYVDGGYEVRFPMVTERRAADPTAGPDQELAGLDAAGFRRPASVGLVVDLDAGMPVEELISPSHVVRIDELDERRMRVELDDQGPIADRDFVLRYRVAGAAPRLAVLPHMDERGGFFTMMLQPAADDAPVRISRRRLTFAVDTSSSMNGLPMRHARAVVETGLESLRPGDSFQIVTFSDLVRAYPDAPSPATDDAIIAAERYAGDLRALGTTSLAAAVDAVLDRREVEPDVLDLVVLVTDGFVASDREIMRTVSERLGNRRLLVVGVGASVNRFLLERLAEIGRGALTVVLPSEDPEVVAQALVERIDRPQLTDLAVDWGDLTVHGVYPRRLPDLYAGQPLLVSGRFDTPGEAVVRLTGRQGGREFEDEQRVVLDGFVEGNDAMAPVWARARVTDLMNALWLEDDPDVEEAVTQLGLEFGLVTRFTSFLAIDDAFLSGLGMGHGYGGLGLSGTGTGGGGAGGMGAIGLGNIGTIGYGAGGTAVAYGMGYGRSAAVPMIRAGSAQIRGSLASEVIRRVVRQNVNQVRACYEQALQRSPGLTGRVVVRFVIGTDGRVQSSEVSESSLDSGAAERCVAAVVHDLVFPTAEGGDVVVVNYPFVFEPVSP